MPPKTAPPSYAPLDAALRLYDHYESTREVKHYFGVLAIYGLARVADTSNDQLLWDRVERILRRFPEQIDHPHYNFPSYRIGGIAIAYALHAGRMVDRVELVRQYADELMAAPRDDAGILVMPGTAELKQIWIDTAAAATPFLLFAGLALDEQHYLEEAVHQVLAPYDELIDPANGLLHQSKNFVGPGQYSADHWGRGNGWAYLALTELLQHLPRSNPHHESVVNRFRALSETFLPYQSERGLWRQEIPLDLSYEESSATGLILYGYGVGLRMGILDEANYAEAFGRGIAGLVAVGVNEDYSTENTCPGCLCPGRGDEKGSVKSYVTLKLPFRDEPHSFAPLILALTEAHLRGIAAVTPADPTWRW